MKKIIISIAVFVSFVACYQGFAAILPVVWNWDSGTTEGWTADLDDTIVTIEAGRNGTFGLGAQEAWPTVNLDGISIDPGLLVGGQLGEYLPMTGQIYVDVDREMNYAHGDYLDLRIYGENTVGRFITSPHENRGSIEDLGDGWYRHHLANLRHKDRMVGSRGDDPINFIYMTWNWSYNAADSPVVYDNLTIVPEPTTLLLLGLAAMMVRRKH